MVRDFCWRVRDTPEVIGWSPLGSEPRIRVRHVDPLPVTAMPDAPPTVGGAGSLSRVSPPFQEMTVQKARPFLLVNDDGPQPALQVCIVPPEFGRSFLQCRFESARSILGSIRLFSQSNYVAIAPTIAVLTPGS